MPLARGWCRGTALSLSFPFLFALAGSKEDHLVARDGLDLLAGSKHGRDSTSERGGLPAREGNRAVVVMRLVWVLFAH